MSEDDIRNTKGRFKKGHSGNPAGRPRSVVDHGSVMYNRKAIFALAEKKVEDFLADDLRKMTMYEANMYRLAWEGAKGDKVAAKTFLTAVDRAAYQKAEHLWGFQMLIERIENLEQQNQELRKNAQPSGGVRVMPMSYFQK